MHGRVAALGVIVMFSLGCARTAESADRVSFRENVLPILAAHGTTCHRAGGPAPFSLTTYADAQRHATQIVAATKGRYMPPWKPAAIRLDSRYSLAHNNLGSLLFAAGRLADARALAAEGRLADAIRTATTTSDQAKAAGKTALLAEIAKQTQLYRSGLKR